MVPLYAARIGDLGDDDRLLVECGCGHMEELAPAMLASAGLPSDQKVLDLQRRLKCQSCRRGGGDAGYDPG